MDEGTVNAALATIRTRSWVVGGRPLSGDQVVEVFRRIQRGQRRRNTLEDGRAFDQAIEVLKKAALVRFDRKLGWLAAGTPEWGRPWEVGAETGSTGSPTPELLDLDRLEALAAAATPGPWTVPYDEPFGLGEDDAVYMAASGNALPALIADVRRLRALVEQQGAEVIETRGALVAVQREIGALIAMLDARGWDGSAIGPLYHAGMTFAYEDVAARLRALVEGR